VTALNRLVQDAGIAALAGLNLEATIQMCGRFLFLRFCFGSRFTAAADTHHTNEIRIRFAAKRMTNKKASISLARCMQDIPQ